MSDTQHKDAPAFDFYPERWIAGTLGMSDAEELCYFRLLIHSWLQDGLPDSSATLCRLARMRKIPDAVLEKFPLWADGKRRNTRLERERQDQRARISRAKEKSKRMHEGRYGAGDKQCLEPAASSATSSPQAVLGACPPPTSHLPLSDERDAPTPPPRGCARRKPASWPTTEAQVRSMAEDGGADVNLAITLWHHYDGKGYWPQGNFISSVKAKDGFNAQDRSDKLAVEDLRITKHEDARAAAATTRPTMKL